MKKSLFFRKGGIVPLILLLLFATAMNAATVTSTATGGPWNFTTTWVGGVAPLAGDDVIISAGASVNLTANGDCKSLTLASTTTGSQLTLAGFTMNVGTGGIVIAKPATLADFNTINVNAGFLNTPSITFTNSGGAGYQYIYVTTGTLDVAGDVIGGGGAATTAINLTGNGKLKLKGNLFTAANGTLSAAAASTVEYYGAAAQNVSEFTYGNLTLTGAGVKTINNFSSLTLTTGVLSIATGTMVNVVNSGAPVAKIALGGFGKTLGVYGTTLSGATIPRDDYFAIGTGTLNVTTENRIVTSVINPTIVPFAYTGSPQGPGAAQKSPAGAPDVVYTWSGTALDATTYISATTKPTKAGSYTVLATIVANENYLGSTDSDAFVISPKTLNVTAQTTAPTKVYDATNVATVTGTFAAATQPVAGEGVGVSFAATYDNATVGTGKPVTVVTTLTGTFAALSNYVLGTTSAVPAGSITKAVITIVHNSITPLTVADKVYDGTTATGAITGTPASITGAQGADVVTATYTGVFADKNVGPAKAVTVTTTLDATSAVNYTVVNPTPAGVTGNITAKPLNISGTLAATKPYDGNVNATITGGLINAAGGLVAGDVVTILSGTNGYYADKMVATGKTVTPNFAITGAQAGNYTVVQPANLTTGVITKKALTVTASVTPKVYDGLLGATITGATLTGVVSPDVVSMSPVTTGTFDTKNVGVGKIVTVAGATLTGPDAGNYSLPATFTLNTGEIIKKALTIPNTPALPITVTKPYDGNTNASIQTSAGLVGVVPGENVVLVGTPQDGFHGTGTFATKNAGSGIAVTMNVTNALTGADAANYSLTAPTGLTGTITPLALTITAKPQVKCFGTVKNLGTTEFTTTAMPSTDQITSVVLTSTGGYDASLSAPVAVYPADIVPSNATGATFLAANYAIIYAPGNFGIDYGALVSLPTPAATTVCQNTVINTPIVHNTSNVTGIANDGVAGANGLPAGVSATYAANMVTISGTPTVAGAFNYSIPLMSCNTIFATGTITVTATVVPEVTLAVSPSATVCVGTSVTYTATPINGGTTPTYVWYKGATVIAGQTSATYVNAAPANGDAISVVMTSNVASCMPLATDTSNVVTMVVNPVVNASVSIAQSPVGPVCSGTAVTYTATSSTPGTLTYQWYKGTTMISGATTATYTYTPAIGNTDSITVRMTSNATTCLVGSPATSNAIVTTVSATITAPTVTYTNGVLVSSSSSPSQVWYNCATNTAIPGATGQTFTVTTAGTYKVELIGGGCSATSVCVSAWPLAVNGFDTKAFSFYPNPVKNELNLSYSKEISSVKVVNILGQVVASQSINATSGKVDTSSLPAGVYLVEVKSGDESKTIKVVKN